MAGESSDPTRIMIGLNEPRISSSETAGESGDPTRILLAVSESSIMGYPLASISCREAFEWILKKIIRSNTSGFKLLILHAQVRENGIDDGDRLYASPEDFKKMKQRIIMRGLHLLEYFVKRCHEVGVTCEAWVKKGSPEQIICNEAERIKPDLLVLGSRGLSPFPTAFLGSVSEFFAKHVDCPVIAVKRGASETPKDPVDD